MSWLDPFFTGYASVLSAAALVTRRAKLNFGAGFVVADNSSTSSTDVTLDPAVVPPAAVPPTANTLVLRGSSGEAKAVWFDSGAAADVLLKRNGTTVLSLGTSSVAAPSGAARLWVSSGALVSSPVNAGATPFQQTIAAAGDVTNPPTNCKLHDIFARVDTAADVGSPVNLTTYTLPNDTAIFGRLTLLGVQKNGGDQGKCAKLVREFVAHTIGSTLALVGGLDTIGADHNDTTLSLTAGQSWNITSSGATFTVKVSASDGLGSHAGLIGWLGRVEIFQVTQ
jgi:hypothetical protein